MRNMIIQQQFLAYFLTTPRYHRFMKFVATRNGTVSFWAIEVWVLSLPRVAYLLSSDEHQEIASCLAPVPPIGCSLAFLSATLILVKTALYLNSIHSLPRTTLLIVVGRTTNGFTRQWAPLVVNGLR